MVGNKIVPTDNVQIGISIVWFDPNGKEKSSVALGIEHKFGKALCVEKAG